MRKQFCIIVLSILMFGVLDVSIYHTFTRWVIPDTSAEMRAKSVEVSEYLPFTEDTKIVKIQSALTLTGDLPVLDGAAALYPVYSAFINAVYPESSCMFQNGNFTPDSCLQMNNTREAYREIADGTADLVFCAEPSEEQLNYASKKGVELEFVPVGRETFVFLVNKNNPVSDLSIEQVQGSTVENTRTGRNLGESRKRLQLCREMKGAAARQL